MKLISAGGSPQMQKALLHRYVHDLINILLQNQDILVYVAQLIKKYDKQAQLEFEEELDGLHIYAKELIPEYATELTQTLHNLYRQPIEDIRYQRGAILELLAFELVRSRYKAGECLSNQRFLDEHGRAITDQVDVAALSHTKQQLEGYECKLKVNGIESSDCTNLAYLANAAQERDYLSNVGIVSFDDSKQMKRKLARLQPDTRIQLYGLDNLRALEQSPF